jgi:hypothetical protein
MDDNFDKTVKLLTEKVNNFTGVKNTDFTSSGIENKTSKKSLLRILKKINFKSPIIYYIGVPIVIIISLLIFKPKIIVTEDETDNNIKKLHIKKLLITTVILSLLIFLGFYIKKDFM